MYIHPVKILFPTYQKPAWEKLAPGADHGRVVGADVGPRGPLGAVGPEGPALRRKPAVGPVGDVGGQSFRYQRSSPPPVRPRVVLGRGHEFAAGAPDETHSAESRAHRSVWRFRGNCLRPFWSGSNGMRFRSWCVHLVKKCLGQNTKRFLVTGRVRPSGGKRARIASINGHRASGRPVGPDSRRENQRAIL